MGESSQHHYCNLNLNPSNKVSESGSNYSYKSMKSVPLTEQAIIRSTDDWSVQINPDKGSMEFLNKKHGDLALSAIQEYYEKGLMCDFTIHVNPSLSIKCHRIILSCYSAYFMAMFESAMIEANSGEVTFHDMDEITIQTLIDFCYTGRLVLDNLNVLLVMQTACFLQMELVVKYCEQFLWSQIDIKNVVETRTFAQQYNRTTLLEYIDSFICKHFRQILKSEVFLQLNADILSCTLASNFLNVPDEICVFKCVLKWVKYHPATRIEHLPELMQHVRLVLLPTEYLSHKVFREPLIYTNERCKDMLLCAMAAQLFKHTLYPVTVNDVMALSLGRFSQKHHHHSSRLQSPISSNVYSFDTSESGKLSNSNSKPPSGSKFANKSSAELDSAFDENLAALDVPIANKQAHSIFNDFLPQGASSHSQLTDSPLSRNNSSSQQQDPFNTDSRIQQTSQELVTSFLTATSLSASSSASCDDLPLPVAPGVSRSPLSDHILRSPNKVWLQSRDLFRPRRSYAGLILCVGGRGHLTDPYRHAEAFDPLDDCWLTVQAMQIKRRHVGLISLNKLVYAVGGHDGSDHLCSAEVYNPEENQWRRISCMLTRRRGLALASLGDCIFCLGGLDDVACFQTVERYNSGTNSWASVAPMLAPRGGLGATTYSNQIFVFGGNNSHRSVNSCERYDPVKNQWSTFNSMSARRAGAAAVTLDNSIYVLGGFDDNAPLRTVERYDPRSGNWNSVSSMSSYRGGVGVAALGGRIYAVGGHDGDQYLDTVEVYDPAMDQWVATPGINLRRAGAGVCFCDIPISTLSRRQNNNSGEVREDSSTSEER